MKIHYRNGDGKGCSTYEATINKSNPFLNILTHALDSLNISAEYPRCLLLSYKFLNINFKNKIINDLEYDLLKLLSNCNYTKDSAIRFLKAHSFEIIETNFNYLKEFTKLLYERDKYSSLEFKGYELEQL